MSKSSQNLTLDGQRKREQSSSFKSPGYFFPGHQEFFYLFLRSVDSFHFGQHLCRRFIGEITAFSRKSAEDRNNLEYRLLRQKMLARFLGILVFSPNWNLPEHESDSLGSFTNLAYASSTIDAHRHMDSISPVIPILDCIERAWHKNCLISVVPWVLDFLYMSKWDPISLKTSYYQNVFRLLYKIQKEIRETSMNPSTLLVSLELESFFSDVVGLGKIEDLPIEPTTKSDSSIVDVIVGADVDTNLFVPSKSLMFALCPHMEELYQLLSQKDLSKEKGRNGYSFSRKMRPHAISSKTHYQMDISTDQKYIENIANINSSTEETDYSQSLENPALTRLIGNETAVQLKLTNAFFLQYKKLQTIAEFVIGVTIKNTCLKLGELCILPIVRTTIGKECDTPLDFVKFIQGSSSYDVDAWSSLTHKIKSLSFQRASLFFKTETEKLIMNGIMALAPPKIKRSILDIAINIAIEHSLNEGKLQIKSLINSEVPRLINLFLTREKKNFDVRAIQPFRDQSVLNERNNMDKVCANTRQTTDAPNDVCLSIRMEIERFISIFQIFTNNLLENGDRNMEKIIQKSHDQQKKIVCLFRRENVEICPENIDLKKAASHFGESITMMMNAMFLRQRRQSKNEKSLLLDIIKISTEFGNVLNDSSAFQRIGFYLCKPDVIILFMNESCHQKETETPYESVEKKVEMLNSLVRANIIKENDLERSFLDIVNRVSSIDVISRFCAQSKYDTFKNGSKSRDFNYLSMLRIRKRLGIKSVSAISTRDNMTPKE